MIKNDMVLKTLNHLKKPLLSEIDRYGVMGAYHTQSHTHTDMIVTQRTHSDVTPWC